MGEESRACPALYKTGFDAPASGERSREGVWEFLRAVGLCTAGALLSFVTALIAVRWRRQEPAPGLAAAH